MLGEDAVDRGGSGSSLHASRSCRRKGGDASFRRPLLAPWAHRRSLRTSLGNWQTAKLRFQFVSTIENKMIQKITPFLWFNGKADEAAKFYTSVFKNSKIEGVSLNDDNDEKSQRVT